MQQSDALIGRQIGGFTVEERIGRGGMATVYRALQPSVNRSVALKVIRLDDSSAEDTDFHRRFEQEANLVAGLEHIHILPIIEYGIDGDAAFIAMRLLRGGALSDYLKRGPLDIEKTAEIFTQVARGLAYAHRRGVIHRDLKPSNIMFDDTGNAYLTDFGLAKLVESSVDLTREGHIVGTPAYMSPEQLRGEAVDPRSDIYSMGVILYHMLIGKPPFESSETNMVTVIYGHLEKAPVPPRHYNPALPPAVEDVILKALEKQPIHRFQSLEEMVNALNKALGRATSMPSLPLLATGASGGVTDQSTRSPASRTPFTPEPTSAILPPSTGSTAVVPPQPGSRLTLWLAMASFATLAIIVFLLLASNQNSRPPTVMRPTTVPASLGSSANAIPIGDEVVIAERVLGERGFIAYIACTQDSEYHATQAREMHDLAEEYGLDLRVYDAALDPYRQITLLERARTDGARALIICPLDISLLHDSLSAAEEAAVPLVFLASGIPSYGGVLLSGDDYQMGYRAGQAGGRLIASLFSGEGRILVLDYPDMPILVQRATGMVDGALSIAPDSVVVGHGLGGTRDNGYQSVKAALEGGEDFNLIVSINDAGSFGAVEALEEAGISTADVAIASVDAEALALTYIRRDYYLRASVAVGRREFSEAAINSTVRLLAGSAMPETLVVPPGEVITRNNVRPLGGVDIDA